MIYVDFSLQKMTRLKKTLKETLQKHKRDLNWEQDTDHDFSHINTCSN